MSEEKLIADHARPGHVTHATIHAKGSKLGVELRGEPLGQSNEEAEAAGRATLRRCRRYRPAILSSLLASGLTEVSGRALDRLVTTIAETDALGRLDPAMIVRER